MDGSRGHAGENFSPAINQANRLLVAISNIINRGNEHYFFPLLLFFITFRYFFVIPYYGSGVERFGLVLDISG